MSIPQYEGQRAKTITIEDVSQPGGVEVGDPFKLEIELRELFENLAEGDPTGAAVKNGNFSQNLVPFTTPTAIDTEKQLEHNLGRVPVCWRVVAPATSGAGIVGSLYNFRAPDATYLYLAVRFSGDVNVATAVVVW